jgi:hypothetical protein
VWLKVAPAKTMKLFSKDGIEMMEVKTIDLNGNLLVIKGKMMGAMATTIQVKPEDMWRAFMLFPWRVKLKLPWLILQGWQEQRKLG